MLLESGQSISGNRGAAGDDTPSLLIKLEKDSRKYLSLVLFEQLSFEKRLMMGI